MGRNWDLPWQMERVVRTPVAFLQLFGDVLARSIHDNVFIGGYLNVLDFTVDSSLQDVSNYTGCLIRRKI